MKSLQAKILLVCAVLFILLLLLKACITQQPQAPEPLPTFTLPKGATTIPVSIAESDAIKRPWLGFGIEWDIENNDKQPLPLTQKQWQTLFTRVDKLHPNWIRSMFDIKWFCPDGKVGEYNFDSSEMRAWYPILDYAHSHHITVVIGSWNHGPWAPGSSDYAEALGDLAQYLIKEQGYDDIRYINGLNEPDTKLSSFGDWEKLAQTISTALNQRGLYDKLTLIGPDTSQTNGWITNSGLPWNAQTMLGAYEWHNYINTCCEIRQGQVEQNFKPQIDRLINVDPANKPVLIGEMGWGYQKDAKDNQYQVQNYQYGVEIVDYAVQLARAGVSGGSAWDLDDAMHNKVWGMWNILKDSPPRPWFYSWSLLCKYFPSNATIYRPTNPSNVRVLAAHLSGANAQDNTHWSVLLVNRNDRATNIALSLPSKEQPTAFTMYTYSEKQLEASRDLSLQPIAITRQQKDHRLLTQVPANSIVLLSS
ncbi:hypothetical protein KDA_02880 [Dictyobacter alpinus]|uniref:Uncharacterized protein n=1 Tax=Dictyobacter alpinus TaxID=2014873 RepID=A0A402B0C6_9CHLR|nr:cellulase family glycosylhydrolase [Dictyobacter alpinus]GCE24804.1 hypothetical protein KDA_02880 [Dictyobacter alpinus]